MEQNDLERARALVMRFGWNATAYQIINPGITLWFSATGDAVVGYVRRHRVRVVAGAPVCDAARLADVAGEFEAAAARAGDRVCYFGAEERLHSRAAEIGHESLVLLGAQPAWDPRGWPAIIATRASLRAQLNRARNKDVSVALERVDDATRPALARVLAEWLGTRGLPPLHFLVEPDTLERLFDRRVFVARRGAGGGNGAIIGFLVASPAPARHGWLIEQLVRGRAAPNGTAELMVDAAMRNLAEDGFTYATLGLSPLSRRAGVEDTPNPAWLRLMLRWVRAHGRRFYNFEGLDQFKAKFQPERWEPVYAIANAGRFAPIFLVAIASAFSDRSLTSTLASALWRAGVTETSWLARRVKR